MCHHALTLCVAPTTASACMYAESMREGRADEHRDIRGAWQCARGTWCMYVHIVHILHGRGVSSDDGGVRARGGPRWGRLSGTRGLRAFVDVGVRRNASSVGARSSALWGRAPRDARRWKWKPRGSQARPAGAPAHVLCAGGARGGEILSPGARTKNDSSDDPTRVTVGGRGASRGPLRPSRAAARHGAGLAERIRSSGPFVLSCFECRAPVRKVNRPARP